MENGRLASSPIQGVKLDHLMTIEDKEVAFLSDRQIGKLVGFSSEWVRQQRHFRRHGKKHSFPLDPIYIGVKPRYRAGEVYAWLDYLNSGKPDPTEPPANN